MNDLFVSEAARGGGFAEALIEACRQECGRRGAARLTWQTAPSNERAQAVYDRVGGHRELIQDQETGYLFPANLPESLTEGVLVALADQPSWPRIRASAVNFIDSERSWAHGADLRDQGR